MIDLKTLTSELAAVRQEVRNLTVLGLRPNLSAEQAEVVRNLERSARAELKLRARALELFQKEQGSQVPGLDPGKPQEPEPENSP